MNQKVAKKLNKAMKRQWREFYDSLLAMPFRTRLKIAWALVTYRKPKSKTDTVWEQRRAK